MKGFVKEFKEFALKGNLMDMAIGIVIGGAFAAVIKGLIDFILMPIIAGFTTGTDFKSIVVTIGKSQLLVGEFIGVIINFLIIALCMFVVVKVMNKARERNKKKEVEEVVAKVDPQLEILQEIRDLLKK